MKIDLHIHSKYSFDSLLAPKRILQIAKKRNLGCIAIVDHNSIKGGQIVQELAREEGLLGICGEEITTDHGDILGLFLNEEIQEKDAFKVIERIKEQGGIAILPHPFKRSSDIDPALVDCIDAIEVFNARCNKSVNAKANLLAFTFNKPIVGGSDAHFYFEIGNGICQIENAGSLQDIRRSILENNARVGGSYSIFVNELMSQTIKRIKAKGIKLPGFLTP